jgi:hypothetical protein
MATPTAMTPEMGTLKRKHQCLQPDVPPRRCQRACAFASSACNARALAA